MKKPILALLAVSAATIPGQALAAEGDSSPTCTPLKVAYSEKNWEEAHPARGLDLCTPATHKGAMNTIHHFRLWREYRQVAPYRGFNEGDPWLRFLAVPAYIAACETSGYRGQGRWSARNSSGAAGVYQLMPEWGAPYPARTPEQKVANHRIASGLSLSNWACA